MSASTRDMSVVEVPVLHIIPDPRPAFIAGLIQLTLQDIPRDDNCPICLIPLENIINEATEGTSASKHVGVTQLDRCGHFFCKQDLVEWIKSSHGSCPTCRDQFLVLPGHTDDDGESSDGGEYIPPSDDMDADEYGTSDAEYSADDDLHMTDWDGEGEDDYSFSSGNGMDEDEGPYPEVRRSTRDPGDMSIDLDDCIELDEC